MFHIYTIQCMVYPQVLGFPEVQLLFVLIAIIVSETYVKLITNFEEFRKFCIFVFFKH